MLQLKKIVEYIFYYNNDRIKLKFGRLNLLHTQFYQ
ncbi:IS3 family transposase [Phocoenobacter skyensis]